MALLRILLVCVVWLGVATQGTVADPLPRARPGAEGVSVAKLAALDAHFQAYVDKGMLAGATTLVARHGKVIHFAHYGMLNKAAGVPMTDDAIFRIYSMTKPITGVALMMLYEEGRFKLSDPVSKYLPEFAHARVYKATDKDGTVETVAADRPITILDLMRHTAGLTYGVFGNTPVDKLYRANGVTDFNQTLGQWTKKIAAEPLLYQPGKRWVYSFAVDVQGRLVEVLSGMTLDQFFKKRIFEPLGMKDTGFAATGDRAARLAEIYAVDAKTHALAAYRGNLYQDFTKQPVLFSGGGGLVSTAADYWRFCQMLLNGGELNGVRLLKPATVRLMATNHLPEGLKGIHEGKAGLGFGLDFAVVKDPGKQGHGARKGEFFWGGMANTIFWIDPKSDLIAIMMTNVLPSDVYPLRDDMRQYVYDALEPATATAR
ncbi:serine hydrolase domain-containing protein [Kordiimonas marina]|uniref:serine hydrolase domain-containing protein n=1 Tax=Kordiimonas marina TaxID=2872312 RepID=UPI001FF2B6C9|nr:serine hydrolase domain-containing protein [Kordiimonas marina]MCJ9428433.1 beta-lactamase family protein [Kordiimonas marina]